MTCNDIMISLALNIFGGIVSGIITGRWVANYYQKKESHQLFIEERHNTYGYLRKIEKELEKFIKQNYQDDTGIVNVLSERYIPFIGDRSEILDKESKNIRNRYSTMFSNLNADVLMKDYNNIEKHLTEARKLSSLFLEIKEQSASKEFDPKSTWV